MPGGYSGTPLARKLGIKDGHEVAILDAPEAWSIPDLDPTVKVRRDLGANPDVVIVFVRSRSTMGEHRTRLLEVVPPEGSLWVAWPRKAGGHVSDVTEQSLRDELLPTGLVDTKVAALDEHWSGLRFVWRKEHRSSVESRRRTGAEGDRSGPE